MRWYFAATPDLFFMILSVLKLEISLSWRLWRVLSRSTQQGRNSEKDCMQFGEWLAWECFFFFLDDVVFVRYCIPVGDDRPIGIAEELFFSECGMGHGKCSVLPFIYISNPAVQCLWLFLSQRQISLMMLQLSISWNMVYVTLLKKPKGGPLSRIGLGSKKNFLIWLVEWSTNPKVMYFSGVSTLTYIEMTFQRLIID